MTNILSGSDSPEPTKEAGAGSPRRGRKDDSPPAVAAEANKIKSLASDDDGSALPSLLEFDDSDFSPKPSSKGSRAQRSVLTSARLLSSREKPAKGRPNKSSEFESDPSFCISTISVSGSSSSAADLKEPKPQKRKAPAPVRVAVPAKDRTPERFGLEDSLDSSEPTPPRFTRNGDELEQLFPHEDEEPSPRGQKSKTRLTFLDRKRQKKDFHHINDDFGSDDGDSGSTGPEPMRAPAAPLNPANLARQLFGKG
jgi:hypothetical protein